MVDSKKYNLTLEPVNQTQATNNITTANTKAYQNIYPQVDVLALDLAVELITKHEGFSNTVYKDIAGVETIGYGETDRAFINQYKNGIIPEDYKTASPERQALARNIAKDQMKLRLLKNFIPSIDSLIKGINLTSNFKAALYSFAYNLGAKSINYEIDPSKPYINAVNVGFLERKASILEHLKQGNIEQAAAAMLIYCRARVDLRKINPKYYNQEDKEKIAKGEYIYKRIVWGLQVRRADEANLALGRKAYIANHKTRTIIKDNLSRIT